MNIKLLVRPINLVHYVAYLERATKFNAHILNEKLICQEAKCFSIDFLRERIAWLNLKHLNYTHTMTYLRSEKAFVLAEIG